MTDDTDAEDRLRELLRDPGWNLPSWPDTPARVRRAARRQRGRILAATAGTAAVIAIGAAVVPLSFPGGPGRTVPATSVPTSHATAPIAAHRVMPAVLGMHLLAAEAVIRNAIYKARITVRNAQSPLPRGEVISQTPAMGSPLKPGARVILVISTG
jgi:hypothetical protein